MIIKLNKIIPSPLAEITDDKSDVWRRDISFEQNKFYLISAESGKGKTSLLSIIFGLRKDFDGTVYFDERNICNLRNDEWVNIRKNIISLVPQGLWLFDELTALENIQIKNELTDHLDDNKIIEYLKICGMYGHKDKPAGILSFGQKQRIAIIRALCQPFEFLLLDEAFSHLDKENSKIVMEIIQSEAQEKNAALISSSLSSDVSGFDRILKL